MLSKLLKNFIANLFGKDEGWFDIHMSEYSDTIVSHKKALGFGVNHLTKATSNGKNDILKQTIIKMKKSGYKIRLIVDIPLNRKERRSIVHWAHLIDDTVYIAEQKGKV